MSDAIDRSEILCILRDIRANQTATPPFNAGTVLTAALIGGVAFVLSLAINQWFSSIFALIKVGGNAILANTIYLIVAIMFCLTLIFVLAVYLGPFLTRLFAKKHPPPAHECGVPTKS